MGTLDRYATPEEFFGADSVPLEGWEIDQDDWHRRPVRDKDRSLVFSNSDNAFIEKGYLYCRTRTQAVQLDRGVVP